MTIPSRRLRYDYERGVASKLISSGRGGIGFKKRPSNLGHE